MTTCIAAKNMTYEDLVDFLERKMSMSHVYQPLLVSALVDAGGVSSARNFRATWRPSLRSSASAGRAEGHWTCAQMIAYLHEHPARRFTTVMGRIAKWEWHDMQDRSRSSSISGQQKMLQHANVLEHSLENRETVECISQFAMLLRVCNRQSP